MLTNGFIQELTYNLPYLGLILLVVPTVGFLVMDKVMARGIDLKKALFLSDNPVAGFEFGMALLLLFFLGFNAVEGPPAKSPALDMAIALGMMAATITLLAITRAVLGKLVNNHNKGQDLNHEIFEQKNWAAACMSVALMLGVVNGMTEENVLGPTPVRDLLLAGTTMVMSLGTVFLYRLFYLRGRSFMNLMFTKDNPAMGVSLLGFAIAANLILHEAVTVVKGVEGLGIPQAVLTMVLGSGVLTVILLVMRFFLEVIINKAFKVSLNREMFDDANVGAGFIDAAVVLGSAVILTGVLI